MSRRLHTILAGLGAVAVLAVSTQAHAAPFNYVVNGSFEDGLTGWTIGGTETQGFPPVAIVYGAASAYPTGAFGEAVPHNNAPTNSPDAVGTRAAYFVSDFASSQSLSQTIALAGGTYQIGFSAYAPANGYANFYDATFSGMVASVALANYAVSEGPKQTWQTFAQGVDLAGGSYLVEFVFNTNNYPSKDIVIDQVYVVDGNPSVVPEPATLLLIGAGLIGAAVRRRRQ